MRGVCALNLEAMTMFHESDGKNGSAAGGSLYSAVVLQRRIIEYDKKIIFTGCCTIVLM